MAKYIIFIYMFILVYLDISNVSMRNVSAARAKKYSSEVGMESKIVGGSPVALSVMPYNAQIFIQGSMCAGSILNSWAVLTAAHCFDINNNIEEMIVQVGSKYVYNFNADQFSVAEVVIHEKYNHTGLFACDIALVFLDRPITFSTITKKTVLVTHKRWMNTKETNFTVAGWGWTEYGGPISKEGLMTTHLRFISSEECSRLHKLQITSDMFCLYGEGSRDTCKGDSGGGVYWNGLLVGITSHGDGCAKKHKPSVYANVYYFKEWIKKEVLNYVSLYCRLKII